MPDRRASRALEDVEKVLTAELGKTWLKAGADHFRDVGRAVGHVR